MNITKTANFLKPSPEDINMIKSWLLGGAGLGGGAALLTAAIKYLRESKEKDPADDDDTLYVYHQRPTEKKAGISAALALTGGGLTTVGTYALVNKIIAEIDKKRAQEELDMAQRAFISSRGYETAKQHYKKLLAERDAKKELEKEASGGKPMGLAEFPVGLALSVLPMLAITGAVTTRAILNSQFPMPKKTVKAPRKIEIIDPEEEELARQEVLRDEDEIKMASAEDRAEFLIRLMSQEKKACDTRNAIAALASDEAGAFMNAVRNVGFVAALNTIKSASVNKVDPLREHIAVSCLALSPELKAPASVIAASEFANAYPMFTKAAAALPEELQEKFLKIASLFGRAIRVKHSHELGVHGEVEPMHHEKLASASVAMLAALANPSGALSSLTDPETIADKIMQTNQSSGMESDEMLDNKNEQKDDSGDDKPKMVTGSAAGAALASELESLDSLDAILNPKKGKTIDLE